MRSCSLCCCVLPESSSKRRRLYGISSSFALQAFMDASVQAGLESVVPPDKGIHGPFLCLPCYSQLEKTSKLKANLHVLSADVGRKIKETASRLGVSVAALDEQQGSTTPSRKRKREEQSIESPGKRKKREAICTPTERRMTETASRLSIGLDEQQSSTTPSRKRKREESNLESPGKRKKREPMCTPVRHVLQTSVVEHSPAVAVVVKRRPGSRHTIHYLAGSMKKIGKSVGRRNCGSIAKQVLSHRRIRKCILQKVGKLIKKDMDNICSKKVSSLLRKRTPDAMKSFAWGDLAKELEQQSPILYQVLKDCVYRKRRKVSARGVSYRVNDIAVIGMCAAILLRHHNTHMNLVQRIVSTLLYSGHAPKQVFRRLQRLLVCLSHKSTISAVDVLAKDHDAVVCNWRDHLHRKTLNCSRPAPITHEDQSRAVDGDQNGSLQQGSIISEDTNSELSDSIPSTSSSTTSIGSQSPSSAGSFSSITVSSSSGGSGHAASTIQPDGIKIVGDNIDKHVKPREMRHDVQAQSLHYFNSYAVKDRLPTAQLEDKSSLPDFSSFDPSKLMPSTADDKLIQKNFTILISRILKKNLPFFEKFATGVPKHIKHKFYKELSKKSEVVPLGILPKCETSHEDMIAIMEHLQQYVPLETESSTINVEGIGEKEVHADHFHHLLFGGDLLTAKRARGSQHVRNNSLRGKERLEGLKPVIEDWHAKVCLLGVIWKRLYNCASQKDACTLYHLRNLINRRNVVKKPEKSVTPCEEFFLLVTEAHICSVAMQVFSMSTATDRPCTELFPEGCEKLNPQQRWNVLRLAVSKIVDQFVDISYPSPATKKDDDRVRAYAKEVLSLGLLLMEFMDAVREGDGERIIRCWKYFLLLFKSSERTNYSVEAFNLLLELEYVMTPRMRQQLTWERTINVHGKSGRNISMDLHMEHINRECKQAMGVLGSNINDSSVTRIGKSIGELMKISQQFDKANDLKEESGRHRRRTVEGDMKKLLTELNAGKVFDHIPGRKHSNFKKMQVNMTRKLSVKSLESWMQQQLQKYQMCYI